MKKKILLALTFTTLLSAQDLKTTVEELVSTNPNVLERFKNYNETKEDITISKSGYYPKIDLTLSAGKERTDRSGRQFGNPDEKFDLNVYQNSLTYAHNIFKGFETKYQVKQNEYRTIASAYSYIETVNDTTFQMVKSYLQVMRQKELLDISQENIDINEEIFTKVQKLYDSGLTTLSEVNKIEASLALARSNYVVQENTLLDMQYNFQKIFGRFIDPQEMQKPLLHIALPTSIEDAAQFAIKNNPSLLISSFNLKTAQALYNESKSPFYPQLDLEISQSINKNLGGIQGEDNRFRAMAYLKYNFFNGFADQAALQKSVSKIHKEVEIKNSLRRDTIEGLSLSWAANEKLGVQFTHLQKYKDFALKTLTLYAKEYDLGRRSLLDLLSAQNDFIGSKSQIINTEYNMLEAKYRILDALGTLVQTVLGDTQIIYSNVGLAGKTPENLDTLPILLDRDRDLIADDEDLCHNSLPTDMRNIYGCKELQANIQTIERYDQFLFDSDSYEISKKTDLRVQNLIKQVQEYGFNYLEFDILAHVDNDALSDEELYTLSEQRAKNIKSKLLELGALESSITLYPKANLAPISTNELSEGVKLNNRVDIIVKKLKK